MYARVDECTGMRDEDEVIGREIRRKEMENEMKKFYLHLQVEVFFGLSCKNLPPSILRWAREGRLERVASAW